MSAAERWVRSLLSEWDCFSGVAWPPALGNWGRVGIIPADLSTRSLLLQLTPGSQTVHELHSLSTQ
jgi:hypothetical protein